MPVKATYPGQNSAKEIAGFKIIACLDPAAGFDTHFHIYLHEMRTVDADDAANFSQAKLPKGGLRGNVTLSNGTGNDGFISYKFNDIDLIQVETVVTYRIKHRLLAFRYNKDLFEKQDISTLIESADNKLSTGQLQPSAKPYKFAIANGSNQDLLYFNSLLNPTNTLQAFQISSFRTSTNSFLSHAIELHKKIKEGKACKTTFKVNGQVIDANDQNFKFMLVDESWGTFLAFPLPTLDTIINTKAGGYPLLTKINFDFFRPADYYNHYTSDLNVNPFQKYGEVSGRNSIETGIIALANNAGVDLSPAIV